MWVQFVPLASYLLLQLLLAILAGWLASRKAPLFQWWSQHPWRAFWAAFPGLPLGSVLLASGFPLTAVIVLVAGGLVLLPSAFWGLATTWRRSRKRAVVIVATWLLLGALTVGKDLLEKGDRHGADITLFSWIVGAAIWIAWAAVADHFARRFGWRPATGRATVDLRA